MRILKVHNYYTRGGGEDTVFQAERDLLRSRGHDVIEYLEHNNKINSMSRATVAMQTIWSFSSYEKFENVLLETKPEIVHFHNTFPLISPSAYYACHDLAIPVVQTLDNQRLICPAASFYRAGKLCTDCMGKTPPWPGVFHACYHDSHLNTAVVATMLTFHRILKTWQTKVDIFLSSTHFYRDLFVQAGIPSEKIVVMPHFVHQVTQPDIVSSTGKYALFLGRLDPEKGVETLLQAWRHVDIPLKIRGSGRMDTAAREYVRKHSMYNVEFVGRVEELDLWDLIENARFLVVPSEGYYETFGMVIVEAYSRGVPVVVSNIGVMPEMVSDQQTGLLFEAGNPIDLAKKASWMWDHPQESRRMGENGLRIYKERFTAEHCYKTLIGVYNRLAIKN